MITGFLWFVWTCADCSGTLNCGIDSSLDCCQRDREFVGNLRIIIQETTNIKDFGICGFSDYDMTEKIPKDFILWLVIVVILYKIYTCMN